MKRCSHSLSISVDLLVDDVPLFSQRHTRLSLAVVQVRLGALKALCSWAARCTGLPASLLALMIDGLAEKKDSLRAAHLRELVTLLRSQPEAAGQAVALASPLLKLLPDALSKPALRGDGVAAMLALSFIASADTATRAVIHADKASQLWIMLSAPLRFRLDPLCHQRLYMGFG